MSARSLGIAQPPISGQTQLAAVIGDPVRHSLSPAIHNAAFAAAGLDWLYVALPVASGSASQALAAMRTLGISGLNVTMPHKDAIAAAVDVQTPAVAKLGACNCVYRDGDQLVGDNTDGDGFVAALRLEAQADPHGMRVAVVGAGGASRAIIDALARNGAARIDVINRSPQRAEVAAGLSEVARMGTPADVADADLIVNATSLGMGGDPTIPLDPELLSSSQIVADIVYNPFETPLLLAAKAAGATAIGGLGMLVHQAAASFERFTGHEAPIDAMTSAAQASLN